MCHIDMMLRRIKYLSDAPIDEIRLAYPEATATGNELILMCKSLRLTRGQMVIAILEEEFEDFIAKLKDASNVC